mgnify:CR=1 FL=1
MKVSMRLARPDDAAAVADLIHQMGYPVSEAESMKRIQWYANPNYLLLVAENEEVVVAVVNRRR